MNIQLSKLALVCTTLLFFEKIPTQVAAGEKYFKATMAFNGEPRHGLNGIINFPDKNFKAALIAAKVDVNTDGEIQVEEAKLVTDINVYDKKISSLVGISFFENLKTLNCASNLLTALDLKYNIKLVKLFCKNNKITALDLSENTDIEDISCSGNQLTSLDLSRNKWINTLECASNLLTALDVSSHEHLKWLDCRWNKLDLLNVSGCEMLETLLCENNLLREIGASVNQDKEKWTKDAAASWTANSFSDCMTYNIVSDAGRTSCLKKFSNEMFSYSYHPVWKIKNIAGITSQNFEVREEGDFSGAFPLYKNYRYQKFENSVNRYANMPFAAFVVKIKTYHKGPQEFDFTHASGKKGKLITFNYTHEGTGIKRYEIYAIIPTSVKDNCLYGVMLFNCYPSNDILGGVVKSDEPEFRKFAIAYFNTLMEKN
jgi:hypothetical protein